MSEVNNDAPEAVVNAHTDLYEVGDPIADAKAPDIEPSSSAGPSASSTPSW